MKGAATLKTFAITVNNEGAATLKTLATTVNCEGAATLKTLEWCSHQENIRYHCK